MIRLLDTSICVQILRGKDLEAQNSFERHRASCHACDVVAAELVFGFRKRPDVDVERDGCWSFSLSSHSA